GAAMHAGRLQNIGHMLGVVDTIELVLQSSGDIHLDKVDIVGHGAVTSCQMLCTILGCNTGHLVGHPVEYKAGYRPTQRDLRRVGRCCPGASITWVALSASRRRCRS